MKASKIKIVVILLLIIFFGLLILFWSSNIYEGLSTPPPSPLRSSSYPPTKWVVGTGVTYDANSKPAKVNKTIVPNPKGEYYIRVYYYIPDKYQVNSKNKTNFTGATIPIIHLDHNLNPNLYNVYYSNSNAFTDPSNNSTNTNIYIQSNNDSNNSVNKLTPSAVWKETAVSSGKQGTEKRVNTQLKMWANGEQGQKWDKTTTKINAREVKASSGKNITNIPLIYSPSNGTSKLAASSDSSKPTSAPTSPPKYKLAELLPIKYQPPKNDKKIVYWDARYGATTNSIPVNKDYDTNEDLGALNLVTYYLTFP